MGNSKSLYYEEYFSNLEKDLKPMIDNYNFWTNDAICNKIELFYYDKLIQFPKDSLLNITAGIGIVYNETNINKTELCKIIIDNFKIRIDILKLIYRVISDNKMKLDRANFGPICTSIDDFIDDFIICENMKGKWLNSEQYSNYLNSLEKNKKSEHVKQLNKLQDIYINYIKKLNYIVDQLKKDISHTLTINELDNIAKTTKEIIDKMNQITNIFYLIIVNI